jgi:DNA (cytosine-5)-methyltransferase 3A
MDNGINVFSGFDGISCCHIGLDRAGVDVASYRASELIYLESKKGKLRLNPSVRITQANYPDTIQLGDIRLIDGRPLKGLINLFVGGSPCQSFSNAGSRSGFDGKSGLFWEWIRLKNEIQPEFWLLENVEMKKEWEDVISNTLGVPAIHINSSVTSAQSRPRVYWTNIPYTPIEDKQIMLSDVVLGAVCGTNKHGKLVPEHLRVVNSKGKLVKWKNIGWEDNSEDKGYCLVRNKGHYRNIQGQVMGYTPENSEALQNVPNGYTNVPGVSNSARHEALGNGWTVDVLVEAFFKNLPWASKLKVESTGKKVKV